METLRPALQHTLTRDYLQNINHFVGKQRTCDQISTTMAIICGILSGITSVLSFSAGYFKTPYVSYAAGCTGILTMVCLKFSYFTRSQGSYYNDQLRYHLTTDYQFLNNFFTNPIKNEQINQPVLPDPPMRSPSSKNAIPVVVPNAITSIPLGKTTISDGDIHVVASDENPMFPSPPNNKLTSRKIPVYETEANSIKFPTPQSLAEQNVTNSIPQKSLDPLPKDAITVIPTEVQLELETEVLSHKYI